MPRRIYSKPWFVKAVFYLGTIIILFVGTIAFLNSQELQESSKIVTDTYQVNVEIEQILSYLKDAETGQRGFLLTKDTTFLEPYNGSREKINNSFAELKELTKYNPRQQENLRQLNEFIAVKMKELQRDISYVLDNDPETKVLQKYFIEEKDLMDRIRLKIKDMTTLENKLLEKRLELYNANLRLTPRFLFLVLLVTLILMLLAYTKFNENLKKIKAYNHQLELFRESAKQSEIVSEHGTWTWNINNDTFEYSDNLYRLLGESPQSFEPSMDNFMKYVHPDDVNKLTIRVEKMMRNEDLPYITYRVIHKDGKIRFLKAYGKTFVSSDGFKRLIGTTTDVTHQMESIITLEERNRELERNNKELTAFNHVASHDLQEPLRKIQTFLSRIEEKEGAKFSESGLMYIERVKDAASRMRLLIDDLLQYSRTNKKEKVFEATNLNMVLEASKEDLVDIIEESHAKIIAPKLPTLNVIPFQIQQLFTNLIGNALKYKSEERPPIITITHNKVISKKEESLKKSRIKRFHKLEFMDNGIGFDNQYAEKIFVLFNRLHGKNDYSGTGIGLSICKKIVENHGGYITAKGIEDEGATFIVYLPDVKGNV